MKLGRKAESTHDIATAFVITAICDFGDPVEKKIATVQAVLDAAGFKAEATCWPVFGGIWPKPCEGKDGNVATVWLKDLTDTMVRGKVEREIEHVDVKIRERRGT